MKRKRIMSSNKGSKASENNIINIILADSFFITAMDMGTKNFSFCIEERLFADDRKEVSHPILHDFIRYDLMENKKTKTLIQIHTSLIALLDKYESWWKKMNVVLIEKQLSRNPRAIRLEQTCQVYFLLKYPHIKVIPYSSRRKTNLLDAPEDMTKYQRKKWAIQKAHQILLNRGDHKAIQEIKKYKKLDDISDCLLMIETYFKG